MKYNQAEVNIIYFEQEDVIATSVTGGDSKIIIEEN